MPDEILVNDTDLTEINDSGDLALYAEATMANKRIRNFDEADKVPAGVLFPLDAAGWTEAMVVTAEKLADLTALVLTPQLVTNNTTSLVEEENSDAIEAALATYASSTNKKGILRLPRGYVFLARAIRIDASHSGLTIDGDGELAAGECCLWFDKTDTASKLMIKARDNSGDVVTGSVALS
ncbi:MAG: hypothetical protein U0746_05075 [Gemmataceae bacterium]